MRHWFTNISQILPSRSELTGQKSLLQRGFTLLETLIVLAIVGILASMVVPRYQNYVVQNEVDVVANELVRGVEMARVNAQSYGYNVKICPVSATQLNQTLPECKTGLSDTEPWEAWVALRINKDKVATDVIVRSSTISPNVSVSGNAFDGRTINEMGRSDFSGFTVLVKAKNANDATATKVILAQSGRVTKTLPQSGFAGKTLPQ